MANNKKPNAKSTSPKGQAKTAKKSSATGLTTIPDPKTYPPELSRAIESFGNMAGYYVQCLPGDPAEKTKQVAGVVSGLQRIFLASGFCPQGWMQCNDGTCVPPGGICPTS